MRTSRLFCLAMIVGVTTTLANAGYVTYKVDTGYQSTDNQTGITVPQFDPGFGTLQSVDFSLQGFGNIMFNLTNTGDSKSMLYGIMAAVAVSLEDPTCSPGCSVAQNLVIAVPSSYYPSGYVGTAGSEGPLAPGTSTGDQSLFAFSGVIDPGPMDCSTYAGLCAFVTGTGTVLDIVDMTDTTSLTAGGSSKSFTESATGDGVVAVTYIYSSNVVDSEVTPEPISMLLFGSGLVALSLGIRRKGSKR